MPKSKRDKLVHLTKVKKKDKEWKKGLVANVRKLIDKFPYIYILKYQNMRNDKFKQLREELRHHSRFCLGSIKVLQIALGQGPSDEYHEGLAAFSKELRGTVGLLFTTLSKKEVLKIFSKWEAVDFARAGSKATKDFGLAKGPLETLDGPLPHTVEPMLRSLKLPVKLNKGVVELLANHRVCQAGQILTPAQAAILRVFDVRMAAFKFMPIASWTKAGGSVDVLHKTTSDDDEANIMEVAEDHADGTD